MNTAARHHTTGNLKGIKYLFILVYSVIMPLFPTVLMADIYRSVDSDGVISFTDSPTCKNATLVVKTAKKHIARHNPSSMGSANGLTVVVRQANRFRKDVLADGSMLITNLPYTLIK